MLADLAGRGRAMELALTGRWVGADEALAMGLVNRVEDDPGEAAAGVAAELAAQGPEVSAKVKSVMAAGGLLDRLRAERQATGRPGPRRPRRPGDERRRLITDLRRRNRDEMDVIMTEIRDMRGRWGRAA